MGYTEQLSKVINSSEQLNSLVKLDAAMITKGRTASKTSKQTKPNCTEGTACGYSCISEAYSCSDKVAANYADELLAASAPLVAGGADWQQSPYITDSARSEVSASGVSYAGPSFGIQRELIKFMSTNLSEEQKQATSELSPADLQSLPSKALRRAYESTMEALDYLSNVILEKDVSAETTVKAALTSSTDELFALLSATPGRAQPEKSREFYQSKLKSEAIDWAKSQGFELEGVNGFTAEATAAHDIAHPAAHRLTGLNSEAIHKSFGKMLDGSGKPSLLAEEALVNIVEHLSMGDTPEASIQNGLRLAKVLSRTQSAAAQEYVRSEPFARAVIGITYDRIIASSEFASIMPVVRDSTFISGTVTGSGTNFSSSASGG